MPTDAESRLWTQLRNRRLRNFRFARQYAIGPYFADFVCRDRWLVIELDGGQHSDSHRDEGRTKYLNSLGYSVLRFWNIDVLQGMDGVLTSILSVLDGQPLSHLRYARGNGDARDR
jgi:very-short-patch-repair endonuclease